MSAQPPPVCSLDGYAWFLRHRDGVTHGPYTFDALLEAAQHGRLASDTVISHPDFTQSDWVPALALPELAAAANALALPAGYKADAAAIRYPPSKHRPGHLGKRIVLVATLLWLAGLPLAYQYGTAQAHHGSHYDASTEIYHFNTFDVHKAEMLLREQRFIERSLTLWSVLYVGVAAAGILIKFVVPDRPWRPDIAM
jgi:hypothetical protein